MIIVDLFEMAFENQISKVIKTLLEIWFFKQQKEEINIFFKK